VKLNQILTYSLPSVSDEEGNSITTSLSGQPSWITLSDSILTISPTLFSQVGTQTLTLTLSDGAPLTNVYTMTVTATNSAPTFTTSL
jgi:hypothetical protein